MLLFAIFIIGLVGTLFIYLKNKNTEKYKGDCINYQEKQFFKKPVPVVWEARFGGCLAGCWGAAFTRVTSDPKYPRFSGYVSENGEPIAEKFRKEGQILKIYGKWKEISDSYGSVFNRMCVPVIDIEKIEIVK